MRHTTQTGFTPAPHDSHDTHQTPRTTSRSRLRTTLTTLTAAAALLTAGLFSTAHAPAAHAHDELVGYNLLDPAQSSSDQSPAGFILNFNNELTELGAEVMATDASGSNIAQGDPVLNGRDLTQNFVPELEAGEYPITWTVVSSDGHRISGALTLTVNDAAPATLAIAEIPTISSENNVSEESTSTDTSDSPNMVLIVSASIAGVGVLAALIVILMRKMRDTQTGNQPKGGNE